MVKPVKPTAPAPALRSNPDTFSVNAEGTITYMFTTFPDYTDAVADFVDAQADAALAAALGGDLPPLTGNALEFLRVNAGETAGEFYPFVTAMDDNRPVATQLEAETGTATGVYMDPLRTAQAIDAQVDVLGTIAGASVGVVGTYAMLYSTSTFATRSPGYVQAGADLRYCSNYADTSLVAAPEGSWMLCGEFSISSSAKDRNASIWKRIA